MLTIAFSNYFHYYVFAWNMDLVVLPRAKSRWSGRSIVALLSRHTAHCEVFITLHGSVADAILSEQFISLIGIHGAVYLASKVLQLLSMLLGWLQILLIGSFAAFL